MCVQSKWDGAFYFMKLHFYYEKYVFNIVHLMCVQNKGEAVFSLLSYFCNMKNVSSKQARSCFNLLIIIILLKCFSYEFYKNFHERCFLNGCSLVYLSNYIKLLRTAAF